MDVKTLQVMLQLLLKGQIMAKHKRHHGGHHKMHHSSHKMHHSPMSNSMHGEAVHGEEGKRYGHEFISEDHGAPALLPQHIVSKDYPRAYRGMGGHIDDLFMGVQKQVETDQSDMAREMKPSKW
jgi:hypothetical protein